MTDEAPPSVLAAWEAVQTGWDERAKHEAFLAAVSQAQSFAWAAKKYKERPGDPIAAEQITKLQKAAVIVLTASAAAPPPARNPYRMLVALLVVGVVAIFLAILMLDTLPRHRAQPAQPVQVR